MKKLTLLTASFTLFSVSGLMAQNKVNRTDLGYAGTSYEYQVDTAYTLPSGFSDIGSDKIWDFTNLQNHESFTTLLLESTVDNGGSAYPGCNLVIQRYSDEETYFYYAINGNEMKMIAQNEVPFGDNLGAHRALVFPLETGLAWYDTSSNVMVLPGSAFNIPFDSVRLNITVTTNMDCDASGELKLPVGSAQALRVKRNMLIDVHIEVWNGMLGWMPADNQQQEETQYIFYSPGCGYELMTVENIEDNTGYVEYRSQSVLNTPVAEQISEKPLVYPNPNTDGVLRISAEKSYRVAIFSSEGRLVRDNIQLNAGDNAIDISNLPVGAYILRFADATNTWNYSTNFIRK